MWIEIYFLCDCLCAFNDVVENEWLNSDRVSVFWEFLSLRTQIHHRLLSPMVCLSISNVMDFSLCVSLLFIELYLVFHLFFLFLFYFALQSVSWCCSFETFVSWSSSLILVFLGNVFLVLELSVCENLPVLIQRSDPPVLETSLLAWQNPVPSQMCNTFDVVIAADWFWDFFFLFLSFFFSFGVLTNFFLLLFFFSMFELVKEKDSTVFRFFYPHRLACSCHHD